MVLEQLAGGVVEVCDVVAAGGDHQPVPGSARPVVDQRRPRRLGGVADGDLAVIAVGPRPAFDLAAAQRLERLDVPRLMLAANLAQLMLGKPFGERMEGAAGLDLRELAVVADEHELRAGTHGGLGEPCEVAGADHPGLVDD